MVATKEKYEVVFTEGAWPEDLGRWGLVSHPSGRVKAGPVTMKLDTSGSTATTYMVSTIGDLQAHYVALEVPAEQKKFLIIQDRPPEVVSEVIPQLGVRDPQRLLLVPDARRIEKQELANRLIAALVSGQIDQSIIGALWDGDNLVVISPSFQRLRVPMIRIPKIRNASKTDREKFEIDSQGEFIFWPSHDVHMGWSQFLQAVDQQAQLRAQQKSDEFNKIYGEAIRQLREKTGLRQSDISGLEERTVRRIENGETRATVKAIEALAATHKMSVNEYMSRLAAMLASR